MYTKKSRFFKPRCASEKEKKQIFDKILKLRRSGEEYFNITDYMDEAYIAVFDNYHGRYSDYKGKVMIVFWNLGVEYFHVFKEINGELAPIEKAAI